MTRTPKENRKSETNRSKIVATYVTKSEKERIEDAAQGEYLTVSDWIRRLALKELERELA